MRRIWDSIAGMLVTAFLLYILVGMIRPYVAYIIVAAFIWLAAKAVHRHYSNW